MDTLPEPRVPEPSGQLVAYAVLTVLVVSAFACGVVSAFWIFR